MTFEVQPILSVIVNILVGLLVSKGIIDSGHSQIIAQELNNALAAIVTLGLGIYSTHKIVDVYKHKATLASQTQPSNPLTVVLPPNSPDLQPTSQVVVTQTGLPLSPKSA